ncbi:MAG: hypothetical protein JXA07_03170 [Spirochaetes bacterium]|nr:hypothetical protein [Spirochaetota bacterium]
MKKTLPYLLLVILLPFCLYSGVAAQEGGVSGTGDAPAIEKSGPAPESADVQPSIEPDGDTEVTGETVQKPVKAVERRKQEVRREPEKKSEPVADSSAEEGRDNGDDGLLMIDHEMIQYNRIPGITIKKDEPDEDLVKVPDEKISEDVKEQDKSEGIFGKKTRTIAGWGIVIFIFILFAIYSRTRSKKKMRRSTVRTITKR